MATREEIREGIAKVLWNVQFAYELSDKTLQYLDSEGIRLPDGERLIEVKEPIAEPEPEQSPKCTACEGKGFIEYEHGLLQVECEVCKGTGEIPVGEITPEQKDLIQEKHITLDYEEALNDSSSRIGQLDSTPRGEHPSKPKQRKKRKAKAKARKRSS